MGKTGRLTIRSLIALLMVTGILAMSAGLQTQAVSKYARITFHTAVCPEKTKDLFNQCHHKRLAGAYFTVYNPTGNGKTKITDSYGEVTFGPRAGSNYLVGEDISSYNGAYVYCSVQNRGKVVLYNGRADKGEVWLKTSRGDVIICDWYYLT